MNCGLFHSTIPSTSGHGSCLRRHLPLRSKVPKYWVFKMSTSRIRSMVSLSSLRVQSTQLQGVLVSTLGIIAMVSGRYPVFEHLDSNGSSDGAGTT